MFLQNSWRIHGDRATCTRAAPILVAAVFSALLFLTLNQSLYNQRNQAVVTLGGHASKNGPIVGVANGRIRGTVLRSREEREFYGFYHIPYGEPPVGKRRFQVST